MRRQRSARCDGSISDPREDGIAEDSAATFRSHEMRRALWCWMGYWTVSWWAQLEGDGNRAAQLPLRWKPRAAARGRNRQFATFGCSRSPANLSRSSVGTRERPQSPTLICSTTSAKAKFQGGPVVHPKSRQRPLWVGSASSWSSDAVVRPRTCADRRSACANDRCRHHQLSPRRGRRSSSKIDRSFAGKTAAGSYGSIAAGQAARLTRAAPMKSEPTVRAGRVMYQSRLAAAAAPHG